MASPHEQELKGPLHKIEEDLQERLLADFARLGVKALEEYLRRNTVLDSYSSQEEPSPEQ